MLEIPVPSIIYIRSLTPQQGCGDRARNAFSKGFDSKGILVI
jgi:hypothetical protein